MYGFSAFTEDANDEESENVNNHSNNASQDKTNTQEETSTSRDDQECEAPKRTIAQISSSSSSSDVVTTNVENWIHSARTVIKGFDTELASSNLGIMDVSNYYKTMSQRIGRNEEQNIVTMENSEGRVSALLSDENGAEQGKLDIEPKIAWPSINTVASSSCETTYLGGKTVLNGAGVDLDPLVQHSRNNFVGSNHHMNNNQQSSHNTTDTTSAMTTSTSMSNLSDILKSMCLAPPSGLVNNNRSIINNSQDTPIDYDTMRRLLRKQRRAYKKQLELEKLKREALEDFLVKIQSNSLNLSSRKSSVKGRQEVTKSTSSLDSINYENFVEKLTRTEDSTASSSNSILLRLIDNNFLMNIRAKPHRKRWVQNHYRSCSTSTLEDGRETSDHSVDPNISDTHKNQFPCRSQKPSTTHNELLKPDRSMKSKLDHRNNNPEVHNAAKVSNGGSSSGQQQPLLPLRSRTSSRDSSLTTTSTSGTPGRSGITQVTHISSKSGSQKPQIKLSSNGYVQNHKVATSSNFPPMNKMAEKDPPKPISYFLPLENKCDHLTPTKKDLAKQAFIERSKRRIQQIQHTNEWRGKLSEKSRDLAAQVLVGQLSLEQAHLLFDTLPTTDKMRPPFFTKQTLRESKRKFQNLPEVRQRREKLINEFELCTNRIRAKLFTQNQLRRTLTAVHQRSAKT